MGRRREERRGGEEGSPRKAMPRNTACSRTAPAQSRMNRLNRLNQFCESIESINRFNRFWGAQRDHRPCQRPRCSRAISSSLPAISLKSKKIIAPVDDFAEIERDHCACRRSR